ncbi:MAG: glycerol-3-phosphate acyltransferase [Oscillospiraceae bacterium]|nr:glycerol-3-phosphate acyltransferase [Oscillospiraceae bacterium]
MQYVYCVLIGYFFGCLSPAYLIGRMHGVDIREQNSGNAGASNVAVTFGWPQAILTAVIDIGKAFAASYLCAKLFPGIEIAPFLGGACAVIGHIFPFYLKFKGGKGYASYFGMVLSVNWKLALFLVVLGVVVTLVTNYIALATISTTIVTPAWIYYKEPSLLILGILLILMAVIIYKHKINIIRIIKKEEIGLRDSNKHRI